MRDPITTEHVRFRCTNLNLTVFLVRGFNDPARANLYAHHGDHLSPPPDDVCVDLDDDELLALLLRHVNTLTCRLADLDHRLQLVKEIIK